MKFTKIKNFTESNEVRIKTSILNGEITNKLVIYIGKEVVDKYFSESNYVNVKVIKDKSGKNDIHLFKAVDSSDLRKYKLSVTGNGKCETRKLLISMPKDIDMNKYINNKSVVYSNIDNTLILHIDNKKLKKTKKSKLTENSFDTKNSALVSDNVKYDSSIIDLLYEFDLKNYSRYESLKGVLYEIKAYLDTNEVIQENILNKLDDNVKRLDFLDKNLAFLSPICKAIDRLEDKIDSITSKNISNENNSKELPNSIYEKRIREEQLIISLVEHKHKTEERLRELENKVKNIKDDKRSLLGRVFGE